MISSISSFEIAISKLWPRMFLWIVASVAVIRVVNPNDVSTCPITLKTAAINGLRELRNPPSWLVIFLIVHFNKIPLFPKDLITSRILFISLFARVISSLFSFFLYFFNWFFSFIYYKLLWFTKYILKKFSS